MNWWQDPDKVLMVFLWGLMICVLAVCASFAIQLIIGMWV